MDQENFTPDSLYKIISVEQWEESLRNKEMVLQALNDEYIYLSKEDQVPHVIKNFWCKEGYVILKLESKKLKGRLTYENTPGEPSKHYHLYDGNIPLEAVVGVRYIQAANM